MNWTKSGLWAAQLGILVVGSACGARALPLELEADLLHLFCSDRGLCWRQ